MRPQATSEIFARPLSAQAFAPYGDVVEAPANPGRAYFETSVRNLRPDASPRLWMLSKLPSSPPLEFTSLERHRFSSQSFVPIEIGRWVVVVAPHAAHAGAPDVSRVQAFMALPTQGVSYRPDVWHGSLTVLDRPARFCVFMWLDGTPADEEFVSVAPFRVQPAQP